MISLFLHPVTCVVVYQAIKKYPFVYGTLAANYFFLETTQGKGEREGKKTLL